MGVVVVVAFLVGLFLGLFLAETTVDSAVAAIKKIANEARRKKGWEGESKVIGAIFAFATIFYALGAIGQGSWRAWRCRAFSCVRVGRMGA